MFEAVSTFRRPGPMALATLVAAAVVGCTVSPTPRPFTTESTSTAETAGPSASGGPTSAATTGAPSAMASGTPVPTAPAATVPPTPRPTPKPTPRPTPKPTARPAGFDPAHVAVAFSKVATIPGQPLAVTNAGDGSGRLFVATKGGRVYIVKGSSVRATPFLDISGQVSGGAEQGLLGLAFHPRYPTDPRVFVDYTNAAGNTVVSSFRVDPSAPDVVVAGSEVVILTVNQPYSNHNGGAIQFGPDGYLYIALGDGGSGGDPQNNAQNRNSLLGKLLRIDIDHTSSGRNYAIPASNPFVGQTGRKGEIWFYGLRNPFRFSFDRATGSLWIGDVGQNKWEEVDTAKAGVGGLNFGWRIMEGDHCYNPSTGCPTAGLVRPVVEYSHSNGCAIIGGNVYRGSAYPVLKGGYVFTDECTGFTAAVNAAATGAQALVKVASGPTGIAGFGEDEAGELFAADLGGQLYRVTAKAR
jgi:glucose/arabinose dehydrogenase